MVDIFNTDKKYKVIYADPPWSFKTWSDKGEEKSAQNHYNCMTLEEINNLPVSNIADDNCILFMWMTFPMLPMQLETIKAWGFEYKTLGFNWIKMNKKSDTPFIGLGYYTRSNPEFCAICTKVNQGDLKLKIFHLLYSQKLENILENQMKLFLK